MFKNVYTFLRYTVGEQTDLGFNQGFCQKKKKKKFTRFSPEQIQNAEIDCEFGWFSRENTRVQLELVLISGEHHRVRTVREAACCYPQNRSHRLCVSRILVSPLFFLNPEFHFIDYSYSAKKVGIYVDAAIVLNQK